MMSSLKGVIRSVAGSNSSGDRSGNDGAKEDEDRIQQQNNVREQSSLKKDPRLFYACSESNWEEAEALIEQGIGLEFTKLDGSTILHLIVQKRPPVRTFEKLLATRALDVNCADKLTLNTPLHYAVIENASLELLRLLIAHGADVNKEGFVSGRSMLEFGLGTNQLMQGGITPLEFAVDNNASVAIMKCLIEAGADVRHVDSKRWTSLHWAVRKNGNPELTKMLLEAGADPNIGDLRLETPLTSAVSWGVSLPIIMSMLRYGGIVDERLVRRAWTNDNEQLLNRIAKVQMMMVLCFPRAIADSSTRTSRSALRLIPSELFRELSTMLF